MCHVHQYYLHIYEPIVKSSIDMYENIKQISHHYHLNILSFELALLT